MPKKLWNEVQGERQFLIPEGIPLEAGSLEIENNSGDKMMIRAQMLDPYLATPEDIEEHQNQEAEATISDIGNALNSLFQAGKEIFTQALSDAEDDSNSEDSQELSEDNVVDVDFDGEDDSEIEEGFFNDINNIFEESKNEFRSIFDEAKIELKKTLQNKETKDFLRSIGHQIVEFANSIQSEDDASTQDAHSDEQPMEHEDPFTEATLPEPPPAPPREESIPQDSAEDSDEIPPSPLPDENE